ALACSLDQRAHIGTQIPGRDRVQCRHQGTATAAGVAATAGRLGISRVDSAPTSANPVQVRAAARNAPSVVAPACAAALVARMAASTCVITEPPTARSV